MSAQPSTDHINLSFADTDTEWHMYARWIDYVLEVNGQDTVLVGLDRNDPVLRKYDADSAGPTGPERHIPFDQVTSAHVY